MEKNVKPSVFIAWQIVCKHKDPKTVMRYDRGRENMEQNAVNFLGYDEE